MDKVIKIKLNNKDCFINKYNEDRLSPKLEEYIKNEMSIVGSKDKIIIEISSSFDMDDSQKEKVASLIKNTYRDDMKEIMHYNHNLMVKDLISIVVGCFLLSIYYFFENIKFLNECIMLIGGFFIWSTLDNILNLVLENRSNLRKKKQLLFSKIKFN